MNINELETRLEETLGAEWFLHELFKNLSIDEKTEYYEYIARNNDIDIEDLEE